jgi:integrase
MSGRKSNGEGSIYRRQDGYWAGSAFVETTGGERKRIHVYAHSRQEAHDRLEDKLAQARKGIRTPDKKWLVGPYLDYWLREVVATRARPRTIENYESVARLHLKPALGTIQLTKLSVRDVQLTLNRYVERTGKTRTAQTMRAVLRTALNHAAREELVVRNVAMLAEPPKWRRKPIQPWTAAQATHFLDHVSSHRLYAAFILLVVYGMRRGEVLGLRWDDVDFDANRLHVRQQLQRIGGSLVQAPVKTEAGERQLPLIPLLADELRLRHADAKNAEQPNDSGQTLIFLSTTGTPLEPRNFFRTFQESREQAGLPRIKVHHTRHTAATLLKDMGVPDKDIQLILGHTRASTTQDLYEHGDLTTQSRALAALGEQLLGKRVAVETAVDGYLSTSQSTKIRALTPGAPGGIRTPGPLFRSLILLADSLPFTPVINHLRTHVSTNIVGWVAVENCCRNDPLNSEQGVMVETWATILRSLDEANREVVRQRTGPMSLLSKASHRARTDS